MKNNRKIGELGENIACKYLESKDYEIISKNYVKNHGEIDIIAKSDNVIIFIEVKYRKNLKFGHPLEAISQKKISKILETANLYIIENEIKQDVRFDVISILGKDTIDILHLENAF